MNAPPATRRGSFLLGDLERTPSGAARQLPQGGTFALYQKLYRHHQKPSPWGRWIAAKRQDGRGSCLNSPENAMPERPQTLRHCSIKNNSSSDYAQSNAERISNRLSSAPQGLRAGSPRGHWCVPRDGSPRRRPARSWSEWGLPARIPAPRTAPRCAPCGRPTARRR